MTFDLAQMIADREAGTPGPWVYEHTCIGHTVLQPGEMNRGFGANHAGKPEPDARRIARVPFLEAEIIRLTARVAELEVALGFYAERNNYHCRVMVQGPGHIDMLDSAIDDDKHGNIARAALSTPTTL